MSAVAHRIRGALALAALLLAPMAAVAATGAPEWGDADGGETDSEGAHARGAPLLGGTHWRLASPQGAVHVWRPRGFRHGGAGTLVYLHGYYTDVDEAWTQHELAEQFRASGRNALFIAAASPVSNPDPVKWRDPAALLRHVRAAGIEVPPGPLVVVAHSGAFRTVLPWLSSPLPSTVVLLDGLYGGTTELQAWLESDARRRLVLVSFETAERSEKLVAAFDEARTRTEIPERFAEFTSAERWARLLYLPSQYGHMELVTEGRVIPLMIRLAGFEPL